MPTREELKMLQALPLDLKVAKTKLRIKEFVEHFGEDEVYVSFSGGKDSTVLMHLVRSIYPNARAVFADTGLEYPEIRKFVGTFENVEKVRPKMSFKEIIITHGYPIISKEISQTLAEYRKYDGKKYAYRKQRLEGTLLDKNGNKSIYNCEKYFVLSQAPFKISDRCCNEMKKKPLKEYKHCIVGTMATESLARTQAWVKTGCNSFGGKAQSKPLSFWTEQDILRYISKNQLKVSSVYGELNYYDEDGMAYDVDEFNQFMKLMYSGCQRTGCVFCGFGAHLDKGESRFQRLKRTHPKLYDYCINGGEFNDEGMWQPNKEGLGMGFVFEWCNERIDNFEIRY